MSATKNFFIKIKDCFVDGFNRIFRRGKNESSLLHREPIKDTNLLLSITIGFFIFIYGLCMILLPDTFLKTNTFFQTFNENAHLIIMACGLSVVMIGGGIDISVAGVSVFVGAVSLVLLEDFGLGIAGTLFLSLGIGLAFGAFQGFLISYLKIQPFIVTLGGMFLARGLANVVLPISRDITKNTDFLSLVNFKIEMPFGYTTFNRLTQQDVFMPATIGIGTIIALVVVVALFVVLRWTKFGRNLYAVGGNSQNALTLGINVNRTKFYSYMLSGLFAGIAGFIYLIFSASAGYDKLPGMEMSAIAACIIGGILLTGGVGNIWGAMFGVLSFTTITAMIQGLGLQNWWQGITIGLVFCGFIVLQSVILGYRNRKRVLGYKNINHEKVIKEREVKLDV